MYVAEPCNSTYPYVFATALTILFNHCPHTHACSCKCYLSASGDLDGVPEALSSKLCLTNAGRLSPVELHTK